MYHPEGPIPNSKRTIHSIIHVGTILNLVWISAEKAEETILWSCIRWVGQKWGSQVSVARQWDMLVLAGLIGWYLSMRSQEILFRRNSIIPTTSLIRGLKRRRRWGSLELTARTRAGPSGWAVVQYLVRRFRANTAPAIYLSLDYVDGTRCAAKAQAGG